MIEVLETKKTLAEENMQTDERLLSSLDKSSNAILHLYDWSRPAFTYGYFINIEKYLNLKKAKEMGLDFSRRPTGGGIVFHIWDYAFSFLMPATHKLFSLNTLENYHFVNQVVLDVMKEFLKEEKLKLTFENAFLSDSEICNFCMARPTKYDVILDGKKIAGAAQRKTKKGYLHQGTISLAAPKSTLLKDVLISNEKIYQAMLGASFTPLGESWTEKSLLASRSKIKELLIKHFQLACSREI